MAGAFKAIIFDFDGVIVDSEVVANMALAQMLTEIGLPTSLEDSLREYCGKRFIDCAVQVEAQLGKPLPDGFIARRLALAEELAGGMLAPVPGVAAFLDRTTHLPRAVASSSRREYLVSELERFALRHHFGDNLFSGATLARGKPHPDVYLIAAEGIGANPADTLAIEDSPTGVASAVAAGMTVAGLLAGSHVRTGHADQLTSAGAHYLFETYETLSAWLDRRP